jgi:hypothetical protein
LVLVLSKKKRIESIALEKKINKIGTNERLRAFIKKYKDTDSEQQTSRNLRSGRFKDHK